MRIAQAVAGLGLLLTTMSAVAMPAGSPTPLNPCPIASRYCRAQAAESGIPHDYPSPAFLFQMRAHCTLTMAQKLAQNPDGLLGPAFAPRLCRLMAAFLGATPGEWRALVIAQMRTGDLKTTAAGRQLARQIKAAAAAQLHQAPAGNQIAPAPAGGEWAPGSIWASREVAMAVARRLRAVRVAMERAALRKTGTPVRLPTGVCRATLVLSAAGRVRQMAQLQCSNEGLQTAFWRAVFERGPLIMLPGAGPHRVRITVVAPIAEPGVAITR